MTWHKVTDNKDIMNRVKITFLYQYVYTYNNKIRSLFVDIIIVPIILSSKILFAEVYDNTISYYVENHIIKIFIRYL